MLPLPDGKNWETQEEFLPPGHQAPKLKLSLLNIIMTPLNNHLTISKIFISLPHTDSVICTQHFLCFDILFFNFLVLLLHDNHVQPVCTFLSCTFLLILIFKSTVYCQAHFLYFVLYILFFTYFILCLFPLCLYSIIFALSMEWTWLIFHCWLYILYIIVYVTNKNLESWKQLVLPSTHVIG